MSQEFDNKLVDVNRWYQNNRQAMNSSSTDMNNKVKFLQDGLDKAIELLGCANKDLRAYEKGSESSGLIWKP